MRMVSLSQAARLLGVTINDMRLLSSRRQLSTHRTKSGGRIFSSKDLEKYRYWHRKTNR